MRRFSQKNSLVTLNEINITPLLDLAFVLLIIFVITRPLIEQSMAMKLPAVGRQHSKPLDLRNVRTVEISQTGELRFGGHRVSLHDLETDLVRVFNSNPDLIVSIRSDKRAHFDHAAQVLAICGRHNITQVSVQTAPAE